jgi:hypothetical protein
MRLDLVSNERRQLVESCGDKLGFFFKLGIVVV